MKGFKITLLIYLLICISCSDDTIDYPETYCYSNVEMDECLFVYVDALGGLEVDVSGNIRAGFKLLVKNTLDEIVELPFSGLFDCIELLDESTAIISKEVYGQKEEIPVDYNLDDGILLANNKNMTIEISGNELTLFIQAYMIIPGPNGVDNPFANISNYDSDTAGSDLWDNFNQLNYDNRFIHGDTVALCLPKLIYKP